jgi:hypothetical protein
MTNRLERTVGDGLRSGSSVDQTIPGEQMSDAGLRASGRQRGQRAVELHVPARLENLAMLRTLVGAIGTFEDLDFDDAAGIIARHPRNHADERANGDGFGDARRSRPGTMWIVGGIEN